MGIATFLGTLELPQGSSVPGLHAWGALRLVGYLQHDASGYLDCMAALAVERYRRHTGHLPETLNALPPRFLESVPLDPFDGQALRYKQRAPGYVVYSGGEDRDGNDGAARPREASEREDTPWDIPFAVHRP